MQIPPVSIQIHRKEIVVEQPQRKRILKAKALNELGRDLGSFLRTGGMWQIRAFFSAGILYLFFYFCKYNLSAATPGIEEEFGFTDRTFGWILTAFLLVYAFGQFSMVSWETGMGRNVF